MDGAQILDTPAFGAEMAEVAERVREIIAAQALLAPADVIATARLSDLGLDSLGLVEVLFALEEAFNISVPFNANDPAETGFDLSTVGAVIAGVEGLLAAR